MVERGLEKYENSNFDNIQKEGKREGKEGFYTDIIPKIKRAASLQGRPCRVPSLSTRERTMLTETA